MQKISIQNRVRVALTGIVILVVLFTTGCSSLQETSMDSAEVSDNQDSRVFRVNLDSNPRTLDPALAVTESERLLVRALYETLVEVGNGELEPALAESWRYSTDGKELYISLRKNLKFSSGKAITVADVEYSLERLAGMNPESPYFSLVTAFVGSGGAVVNSVQVLDNANLVIRFSAPRWDFIEMLAHPCFSIVSQEETEAGHQVGGGTYFAPSKSFGSSGPLKLVEWINNSSIVLEPNKKYYSQLPEIDRLELVIESSSDVTMYDFGTQSLDLIFLPQADLKNLSLKYPFIAQQVSFGPIDAVYFLSFNSQMPLFRSAEARQAVISAIDVAAFIEAGQLNGVGKGEESGELFEVSKSPLRPMSRDNGVYSGNPRNLYNQFAGGNLDGNELVVSYPPDQVSGLIAENLKQQIEDTLGITVKLQEMAADSPLLYDGAAHLSLVRWKIPPMGKDAFFPYFFGQGVTPFVNGNPVGIGAINSFRQVGAVETADRRDSFYDLIADEISGQLLLYGLVDAKTIYAIQENKDVPKGLEQILGLSD